MFSAGIFRGAQQLCRRGPRPGLATIGALCTLVTLAACTPDRSPDQIGDGSPRPPVVVATAPVTVTWPSVSTIAVPGKQRRSGSTTVPADTTPASSTTVPGSDSPFAWNPAGDGVDSGTLTVPANYDEPDGATFTLSLVRHRATNPDERIGTLLVSPDGPGGEGTRLALSARQLLDPELVSRFDIIGWDARGTGTSVPTIDCIDDYDKFYTSVDRTPEENSDRSSLIDLANEFFEGCASRTDAPLENFSTNNSAQDIESIRAALGEDQVSFLGFGYGSELGATWLSMYPETARAVVFDGAPDPRADFETRQQQRFGGYQDALERFFADCERSGCGFAGSDDPEERFVELLDDLDDEPVPAGDRPSVNRDVAVGAAIEAMYNSDDWGALDLSLQAAQQGDGSGLMALYDRALSRRKNGTYPNQAEVERVVSCVDLAGAIPPRESDDLAKQLSTRSPLVVPDGSVGDYTCTSFGGKADRRSAIDDGDTAATILVLGTTGGSRVPLASSQAMASALGGAAFLEIDTDQHLGYDANRCVVDAVNDALIDLTLPNPSATC